MFFPTSLTTVLSSSRRSDKQQSCPSAVSCGLQALKYSYYCSCFLQYCNASVPINLCKRGKVGITSHSLTVLSDFSQHRLCKQLFWRTELKLGTCWAQPVLFLRLKKTFDIKSMWQAYEGDSTELNKLDAILQLLLSIFSYFIKVWVIWKLNIPIKTITLFSKVASYWCSMTRLITENTFLSI